MKGLVVSLVTLAIMLVTAAHAEAAKMKNNDASLTVGVAEHQMLDAGGALHNEDPIAVHDRIHEDEVAGVIHFLTGGRRGARGLGLRRSRHNGKCLSGCVFGCG